MRKIVSKSLEETQKIAHDWLSEISNTYRDLDKALVVGLSGHLGAGKTAFVKAVAKEMGMTENITSPTFVIMKMYTPNNAKGIKFNKLIHIDMYRLENFEEVKPLGFDKLVADDHNLIMVEWPENVGLKTDLQINMRADGEGVVEIEI